MNKEQSQISDKRAIELLDYVKSVSENKVEQYKKKQQEVEFKADYDGLQNNIDYENDLQQAIDLAIESLQEDKVMLLYCADGKVYVVDSKKSLAELSSESCDKCKRNEELDEIRKDFNFEPYFEIKPKPYERNKE